MKKEIFGILIITMLISGLLSGCKTEAKNPYKGQDIKFDVKAEFLNDVSIKDRKFGDKDNFVIRVNFNIYNIYIPEDSKKEVKQWVLQMLTSDSLCIEAGDYKGACKEYDISGLKCSVKNQVIKGAVLYYVIPVKYLKDNIRFAVYNAASDVKKRELLYELSDFNKINFKEDIYEKETEDLVDKTQESSDNTDKPKGIEYFGSAAFSQAEEFNFDIIFSSDKSKVLFVELRIKNLKLEQKVGNTVNTYQVGETIITDRKEHEIIDGKLMIIGGDYTLNAVVLDSCIYGLTTYKYTDSKNSAVSIDLGLADTILQNVTNPGKLPDNITELLKKFKDDNIIKIEN